MAQKTVIDALIVTLGLDPKNFEKGKKEAAAAIVDLQNKASGANKTIQDGAEKSGNALMAFGKRVATVATIFKVLKFTTQNILEMSRATYDLANASRALGEAPRMLRNFENVGEMFGGTADAVRKSVQGIKQAVHDLAFNGQMSQQLVQLGRLGVQFQDARGRPREFKDIAMDTAAALQRNVAAGTMSESDAMMMGESAGFDPGLLRAMMGGRDSLTLALAQQEKRRQVSGEDIAAATANERAITGAGQAKDTAFTRAQTASSGLITRAAGVVEGAYTAGATGDMSQAWEAWTAAVEPVTNGLGDFADALRNATAAAWDSAAGGAATRGKGRANYEGAIQSAARIHGLDPEYLAGVLHTESRFNPNAVSAAGAVGIAQFMPATAKDPLFGGNFTPGKDPSTDIMMAARYLSHLRKGYIAGGMSAADADTEALYAYNAGPTALNQMESGERPWRDETLEYPGRVMDYMARGGGGGSTTTVQIDEINVVTAATDANGIAGSIGDATQRKLTAAQADQGMR